jgi:hypothetical protein
MMGTMSGFGVPQRQMGIGANFIEQNLYAQQQQPRSSLGFGQGGIGSINNSSMGMMYNQGPQL